VVERAGNTAGFGAGKVGGVGERAEDHLGGAEYFPPVGVGDGVPEEAVEVAGSWCRKWVRPAPRPGHRLRAGRVGPWHGRNKAGILR
jgi:hypothetical protein